MIVNLLKYLRGYVTIRLMGFSPERFLNLCSNHNIILWNLANKGNHYEMCISLKGFRQLKPILRKTKTKIVILEKHGLPFFLHRYRKRKIFFMGIVASAALIFMLSTFVWNIHVDGNYTRTTDVILEYLAEEGIIHGIAKRNVDCKEIARLLRAEFDDIIWVSAKIEGTRLMIEVQENTDTTLEESKEYENSNLVANKNGIVTKIITRAGIPQVTVGDTVAEGDLLVLGRIDIVDDAGTVVDYQYCPSDADIYVQTTYSYEDTFDLKYKDKEFTGATKDTYYLHIFNQNFQLPFKSPSYEEYDEVTEEKQLKLTENFYLPISLGTLTINEYKTVTKQYTKEEAIAKAQENLKLFNEKLREKGIQISENNVKIEMDNLSCKASGEIIVIEKIGKRVATEILNVPEVETEGTIEE